MKASKTEIQLQNDRNALEAAVNATTFPNLRNSTTALTMDKIDPRYAADVSHDGTPETTHAASTQCAEIAAKCEDKDAKRYWNKEARALGRLADYLELF